MKRVVASIALVLLLSMSFAVEANDPEDFEDTESPPEEPTGVQGPLPHEKWPLPGDVRALLGGPTNFAPGETFQVDVHIQNGGSAPFRLEQYDYFSQVFQLSDVALEVLPDAISVVESIQSGEEDPRYPRVILEAWNSTPMWRVLRWQDTDVTQWVEPQTQCGTPIEEWRWDLTHEGAPLENGTYLYAFELMQSPVPERVVGYKVFTINGTLDGALDFSPLDSPTCAIVPPLITPAAIGTTEEGFSFRGSVAGTYRWAATALPVAWRYNAAEDPDDPTFMTSAAALTAFQDSAAAWEAVTASVWDLTYAGTTTAVPGADDTTNAVGWEPLAAGTRGVTTCWPSTGNLIDQCDMELNSNLQWSAPNLATGRFFVQDVATHEFGHFILLGDLLQSGPNCQTAAPWQTMCQGLPAGQNDRASLEWGDMAGERYVYPLERTAVDSTATGTRTGVGSTTGGTDGAAAFINSGTTPDLVVGWVSAPTGDNTIHYRIGWDLSVSGIAASWSLIKTAVNPTDTGARTGVGDSTDGLAVEIANIDGDSTPDLFVAWGDNPSGENEIYYRIGWDISTTGDPASWSPIRHASQDFTVGTRTGGIDACIIDIDSDSDMDLILGWMDGLDGENAARYIVGKTMSTTTGIPATWSTRQTMGGSVSGSWEGSDTQGFGFDCFSMNGGGVDYVFAWIDDSVNDNEIYYRVGENVGTTGITSAWYKTPTSSSTSALNGPGFREELMGDQTQGLGLALADLDPASSESDEMIFVWTRDDSGENTIFYWVEFNGQYRWHD